LPKSIGKPPVLWTVNNDTGVVLGLECILNEFRLSIMDVGGNTIRNSRKNFSDFLKGDKLLDEIKIYLDDILDSLKKDNYTVIGLGLALAGLVDNDRGIFLHSFSLEITNELFQQKLEDYFHFPVQIENDANAGALCGIWYEGNNNIQKNVIFASINDVTKFIGTGLIINNKLYKGRNFAGEVMRELPKFLDIVNPPVYNYPLKINVGGDAVGDFLADREPPCPRSVS